MTQPRTVTDLARAQHSDADEVHARTVDPCALDLDAIEASACGPLAEETLILVSVVRSLLRLRTAERIAARQIPACTAPLATVAAIDNARRSVPVIKADLRSLGIDVDEDAP